MSVELHKIRLDGGTQSRAAINEATVAEYADAMADPVTVFPPVTVYFDGQDYWLADGFHRVAAWAQIGRTDIPAEIRQGDRRQAVLHSVAANAAHGLRRTNDDKRRAVLTLLEDAEWSTWADREIARRCGVSQPFVSGIRASLSDNGYQMPETRTVRRDGTVYQQSTANIGGCGKVGVTPSAQENKAETAKTPTAETAPVEPGPSTESTTPEEDQVIAKARRDLAKLTREGLEDEVIGLRANNADLQGKVKTLAAEIAKMKEDLAAYRQDDLGRALGNAQRQARTAEGRMKEYQAATVRADRRAKILEAEVKRLRDQLNTEGMPL